MSDFRLTIKSDARNSLLDRQLNAFKHDVRARQKHAHALGGMVRSAAKQNIRGQKTFEGQPFTPRQASRKKATMLRGLAKKLAVISKASEGGGVIVGWRNNFEAGIAGRHQWGQGEDWTPQRARAERGIPNYKAPCTRAQAKALNQAGYRRARKGKPAKKMSAKALQQTLTLGQAALILRLMRTGQAKGKQHWRDTVPARPFLGVTSAKAKEYSEQLAAKIMQTTRKG